MKKATRIFLILIVLIILLTSALGGAIADRLFVFKPLDRFFPRFSQSMGLSNTGDLKIVSEESVVIDVAEKSSPSVVTISITRKTQPVPVQQLFMDPFGTFTIPGNQQTPQEQTVKQDIGTGFVVDAQGLIVTNKHVVLDTQATYKIITNDNKEYDVQKIYRDPSNDLAILKVDATLTPLPLGDSSKLKVGQFALAIGTALGEFRHTVTSGVISGLGRGIDAGDGVGGFSERLDNVIQTDAAINPGNSGGPLINSSGEVIGVNVAVAQLAQSIGFAIPINVVKESLSIFNKTGQFDRAFFGVQYRILPKKTALLNDVPEGAYIVEVVVGSAASDAGLKPGDIITKIDSTQIKEDVEISDIINQKKVGDTIKVEYYRDGQSQSVTATLKPAPTQ